MLVRARLPAAVLDVAPAEVLRRMTAFGLRTVFVVVYRIVVVDRAVVFRCADFKFDRLRTLAGHVLVRGFHMGDVILCQQLLLALKTTNR